MKVGKAFEVGILSTALALSVIGCAKDETNTATKASDAPKASENATSKPEEKVKIIYSMWGSAEEGNVTQGVADKFNASQDRIEVEVQAIPWENYMTKLNTMATAEQLPDTGMLREDGVVQWSTQGMLNDVNTMYEGSDSKPLDSLAYKYRGKP